MSQLGMDRIISLGFPMGAKWLCTLAFLAVIVGVVVLVIYLVSRPPPVGTGGFPVAPSTFPAGPAEYQVFGVDRQTKMDRIWRCTADSPENARVKGELEGIVVTRVERV